MVLRNIYNQQEKQYLYTEEPAYRIHYLPTEDVLLTEVLLPLNEAQYRAYNDAMVPALQHYGTGRMLRDNRRNGVISQANQEWMVDDWFPRALQAGLRQAVILNSPDAFNQFAVMNVTERLAPQLERAGMQLRVFATPEEGLAWLRSL